MSLFLLALQPNSDLGRLHETFRFTSVTRSRTIGRTPWRGDQLVANTNHYLLLLFPGVGWDWIRLVRRPLFGLLWHMMSVEQSVKWELAGETEVLGENLSQWHFIHHKSHMTWRGGRTRAAVVGSRWLTAWAIARPHMNESLLTVNLNTTLHIQWNCPKWKPLFMCRKRWVSQNAKRRNENKK
jgi:hypothetical protein